MIIKVYSSSLIPLTYINRESQQARKVHWLKAIDTKEKG